MVAMVGLLGHVIAGLDRQDADEARDGRDDGAALELELGVALRELGIVERDFGIGDLHQARSIGVAQRPRAFELGLGVGDRHPGALQRDLLGLRIEPRDDRAGLDQRARAYGHLGHAAGLIGGDRHRGVGAAGADRLKPVVDGGRSRPVALTTAVCGPARPPARAVAARPRPSARGVAASAQSMPQRARISGAPGKKRTQAAAATSKENKGKSNLFPGSHRHSRVPTQQCLWRRLAPSTPEEGVTARILDAKHRKVSTAPL